MEEQEDQISILCDILYVAFTENLWTSKIGQKIGQILAILKQKTFFW